MQDLGTLGGANSFAWGINESGQVVGEAQIVGNLGYHAFLYKDGVMTDLNSLLPAGSGWELLRATRINAAVQITGYGILNGEIRGFLLTPINVTPTPTPQVGPPTSKDQCKKGGWQTFNTPRSFKNQGDCVSFVETGK
jgi:probable HAF family extracellular repeat protein